MPPSYEEYLRKYLCKECHIGFLKQHIEFYDTLKCNHCGFAIRKKDNEGHVKDIATDGKSSPVE